MIPVFLMAPLGVILAKRGLEAGGRLQAHLSQEALRRCEPYTPRDTGALIKGAAAEPGHIRYPAHYAKTVYYGVRHGKPLCYRGGGMRGAYWFERMKTEHKRALLREIAALAGGREKE